MVGEIADAVTLAGEVARGDRTAPDLVSDAIERIKRLDGQLNAVIHPLFEKASAIAEAAALPGPFRGVPMLAKDALCHTAGDPYHAGMRLLRDRGRTEAQDTDLASRFRRAGLVIVGRTNTPELATAFTTEPAAYGPTRNPWDLQRSAGGSSGGSAAAVAAGMIPVEHGNDMGGSIRVPASQCGVVGLKPTRARTSLAPDFGEYWGMLTHEGVLTRSVRDTAAVLDAVHGAAVGDPYAAPHPARRFGRDIGVDPDSLRVGLQVTIPVEGTQPDPPIGLAQQGKSYNLFGRYKVALNLGGSTPTAQALGANTPPLYFIYDYYDGAYHNATNTTFVNDFKAANGGQVPNARAYEGYTAVLAYAAAIKKANSTDPQKVESALAGMTFNTPKGALTFRPQDHLLESPVTVWQVVGDSSAPGGFKVTAATTIAVDKVIPAVHVG